VLSALFRCVRVQTVETVSGIRLDVYLGALVRHFGQQCAIKHGELGTADLDDDGVTGAGDHLALERFRIDIGNPTLKSWVVRRRY